ncbi:MAG: 23S rRNA (adenine(2503)-C(2))-methyltransferase RlmN [Deltaproteobacteria bacterium]|nr:23S rRNA (adenine(2503)-C(2))-methyltransferase RlmN [Deltaproteobacteria bacterium]
MSDLEKKRLLDLSPEDLQELVVSLGEKPYRGEQLAVWLFRRGTERWASMTDISVASRDKLAAIADLGPILTPLEIAVASDGTRKILWSAPDQAKIESVLIPERDHLTLCISTQVGCQLKCRFCRTGEMGFARDLSQGEILGQILGVKKLLTPREKLTNIVFMGMGEPGLALEPVMGTLAILTSPRYLALSGRHISLSTAGVIPALKKLGESGLDFGLTISLGAPTDELRDKIMPINRQYPLKDLKKALAAYPLRKGRRITIAYILLKNVNDSPAEALALSHYVTGLKTKINLIPFNPWPGAPFERPSDVTINNFWRILYDKRHTVMIRWSKGGEIAGACGQLAGEKNLKNL